MRSEEFRKSDSAARFHTVVNQEVLGQAAPERRLPDESTPDVQAALTALCKRPHRARQERNPINFRELHLEGARPEEARLDGADLSGAQLQRARLTGAQLQHANLTGAQPQQAHLAGFHVALKYAPGYRFVDLLPSPRPPEVPAAAEAKVLPVSEKDTNRPYEPPDRVTQLDTGGREGHRDCMTHCHRSVPNYTERARSVKPYE